MQKNMRLEKDLDEVQRLFLSGQKDLAFKRIDKIVKKYDKYYLPYNYRGIILLASKKFDLALADFKKVVSINPEFAEGYCNIGNVYQALNHHEKSLEAYQNALKIDSSNIQVKLNLGMLSFKQGCYQQAIEIYQDVLNSNNQIEYAHHLIADAYVQNSNHENSLSHHQKALAINPSNPLNYFFIGRDYLWSGKKDLAIEYIQKALEINPRHSQSYLALTKLQTINPDNQITQRINLLLSEDISSIDKAYLYFSMAKIYEEEKEYDKSFNYLVLGNQCMKKHNQFDFMKYEKKMLAAMRFYEANIKQINLSDKNLDKKICPIFILGMPRTGSSLIEQILSNHPSVFGAGELDTLDRSMNELIKEEYISQSMIENFIYRLRKIYLERLVKISDKPYIIDKMPINFFWIGYIKKIFPNAKIINTIRNPIATNFSIFKTLFSEGSLCFSYDQDDIINFYNMYKKFMEFWLKEYPGEILDVRYEDFVSNSRNEAQKIFDYVGLDYPSDCLDLKNNYRSIMTASDLQVRGKIYQDSSDGWTKYESHLEKFKSAY